MSNYFLKDNFAVSASTDDISGTGDTLVFRPSQPIDITRFGLLAASALDVGSMVVELQIEKLDGTGTQVVDSFTLTVDKALGDVVVKTVDRGGGQSTGVDGSKVVTAPGGPIRVVPGQQAVIAITTAGTSGNAYGFINYLTQPFEVSADNVYEV